MSSHRDLSDEQLEVQFEDTSLNPKLFNHEAHIRLAYIHIKKYGKEEAAKNLCIQIKRYDQTHGDGTKFNKEITVRSVGVVARIIGEYPSHNFQLIIENEPKLIGDFAYFLSNSRLLMRLSLSVGFYR